MITVADIRARVNVSPDDEQQRVGPLVAAVNVKWEQETGRLWTARTSARRRIQLADWQMRARDLYLDLYPVTSLVLKHWDRGLVESDADTLVADTDYELIASTGTLIRLACSGWRENVLAIVTGGTSAADAALYGSQYHYIREALINQVIFWMNRFTPERVALSSQSGEMGQTNFLSGADHPMFVNASRQQRFGASSYRWAEG